MQLGIFAKTFTGTSPGPVLAAVRAAGFSAAQYNMACSGLNALPDRIPPDAAEAVAKAAAAQGLNIAAVSATYNMAHPDPAARASGRAALAAIAAAAPAMGTRLLTLCTGSRDALDQWRHHPDNQSQAAWSDMRAECEALLAIAEEHDLLLGIEPELGNVVNSASAAARLLREAGSPRLRIVFDPANLFERAAASEQRHIFDAALDMLGGAVSLAHAKDRTADGGFAAAGLGVIDWAHYLGALKRIGFDGALIVHGLTAQEAPDAAAFLGGIINAS
jgi:sugar phosphate isomerase/epimerase